MRQKRIATINHIGSHTEPDVAQRLGQERIKALVTISENGCWLFQGFLHSNGYADINFQGKQWRAHRLAYFLWKGPIPAGHDICHTCDIRHCLNPEHLWSGRRQLNNRDTTDKRRNKNMLKTHCPRGHAYEEHGRVYAKGYKGWRSCMICQRARCRIKAGWPEDLAYSLPATPHGLRPWAKRLSPQSEGGKSGG